MKIYLNPLQKFNLLGIGILFLLLLLLTIWCFLADGDGACMGPIIAITVILIASVIFGVYVLVWNIIGNFVLKRDPNQVKIFLIIDYVVSLSFGAFILYLFNGIFSLFSKFFSL